MTRLPRRHPAQQPQRGVAALEFALVLLLLLMMMYGLVMLGSVLYAKQAVSRAAGDGARAALAQRNPMAVDAAQVQDAVLRSLSLTQLAPLTGLALPARLDWLRSNVAVDVVSESAGPGQPLQRASVTVSVPFLDHQPLPVLPLPGASGWMPRQVTGRASVVM